MSEKTKKIVLIGNGFDLRTGVKTTFREFFRFVIYGVIWHNYSKSEVLKTIITNDKHLIFKVDTGVQPEEIFPKYFNEKIQNKVKVIADVQREKERENWEKEHPNENLLPSKHPLEILLKIEKEEKNKEKRITISDYCRKLIDTEFGKYFFKHLLKSPYLEEALRIDLSEPAEWLFGYGSGDHEANDKFLRWSVIYGLKDTWAEMGKHNCIPNDTNLGRGLETIAHIVEYNLNKSRGNIALWSDVETVIELLITRDKKLKTKYKVVDDLPEWDSNTLESFSDGLNLFEILLTKYLSEIQNIDITKNYAQNFFDKIVNNHIESLTRRSHGAVDEDVARELLDISNADIVINYNYTNIAKRLFEGILSSEQEDKIVHINGSIESKPGTQNEFETNIVVGYTNFSDEDVSKDLYPFEKICRRIIKNTEYLDINDRIDNSWFDLVIIGHSCGMADSDVLGKLLCNPKLNNAVILCHSINTLVSNFNNIKKVIDLENYIKKDNNDEDNKLNTFSDLISYTAIFRHINDDKPAKNLFFAVENSEEETANPEEADNPRENTENADTTKKYKVKSALCLLGACLLFILGSCIYLV